MTNYSTNREQPQPPAELILVLAEDILETLTSLLAQVGAR